jgi:hypothetical protein
MLLLLVSRHSVLGHAWTLSTNAGSHVEDMDTLRTFGVEERSVS